MESQLKDVWRIVLKGDTPDDVQGINLRNEIARIAKNLRKEGKNIRGQIRNIKGEAKVEILCQGSDVREFIERLKKFIDKEFKGKIKLNEYKEKRIVDLKDDFVIIREDDLTEMVWALRGAGKVFERLIKLIDEKERERESKRKKSLLLSLENELSSIYDRADRIERREAHMKFRLFCIENFLKEPPIDVDIELTKGLNDLYEYCDETNNLIDMYPQMSDEETKLLEDNIDKIKKLVDELLKKMKEEKPKEI
ncbi:hypothetical protein DRN50_04710 [Thermococci archaeon]|nr:MAG: hypothetical protein DRN50_04710 [Thermococci archaeon]